MRRLAKIAVCLFALAAVVACESTSIEVIDSTAYLRSTTVKGQDKNCAVVLRAQQGTSYTLTIESEDSWATFSGSKTEVEGTMDVTDKVVYIYFDRNKTGVERQANLFVHFSDGITAELSFTQLTYDATIAFEREWAELPLCKDENDYIFNTHYGVLGVRTNARNYTFCFDPSVRASLWVAYPLHSAHTTGSANRNNSRFGYDPTVSTSSQANMGAGSYSGWYDRGHQIPAADRKCSQQMMDQTFYATNMTPQQANFNQNKWANLEGRVRGMVCSDTLYVVTGAYFDGQHDSSIATKTTDKSGNTCPTPSHYYKALLRTSKGNTGKRISEINEASELRGIAFWFTHSNTGENTTITSQDCISIEELERRTGFTFFPSINDSIESEVKSNIEPSVWGVY